jgi:hypothetical protein
MGLCLCVFGSEDSYESEEAAECDVGHYSDFGCFRDSVARYLGADNYPTLMHHSDCDGEWTLAEISVLEQELHEIGGAFMKLPPEEPIGGFEHTAEHRAGANSLYDCFHNVNGENLFESVLKLCAIARKCMEPITFM